MLKGYFDDSGTDQQSAFCVIGGYISTVDCWKLFSEEWQNLLDEAPSIKYLKMREAESRRGEFWGWTPEARDQKLLAFANLIKKNAMIGLASIVSNQAYDELVRGGLPPTIDNPYWFCFQAVVIRAIEICGEAIREEGGKIDFVFDSQGEGMQRRGLLLHDGWKKLLDVQFGDIIGGIDFHDDKDILPLQAADMFAWHLRRYSESALNKCRENRPVADVLWSIPIHMKDWHPAELINFVKFYQRNHPETEHLFEDGQK